MNRKHDWQSVGDLDNGAQDTAKGIFIIYIGRPVKRKDAILFVRSEIVPN